MRLTWTRKEPFDFKGQFYKTNGTQSHIPCVQRPHIPIYGGGGSDAAINSLAPYLDTFMLWGEPLRDTECFMARVRNKSKTNKKILKFSLSTRPILADTESKAWEKAETIHKKITELRGGIAAPKPSNVGSQRLLSAAAKSEIHDTCLWTKLAVAT